MVVHHLMKKPLNIFKPHFFKEVYKAVLCNICHNDKRETNMLLNLLSLFFKTFTKCFTHCLTTLNLFL